jgi:predicted permease
MLESVRRDAAFALRGLSKSPVFTLVAVLSVAIGIGATTAIVTLGNALLFKPAPGVGEPDRVVNVGSTRNGSGFDNFSYPAFLEYRSAESLSGLASIRLEPLPLSLVGPSGGEPVRAGVASGNLFEVLRARPSVGRFFAPDEDAAPGANPAVVLSHRFWRDRFNREPAIVGRNITLNAQPFAVVGVAAEGFHGPLVVAPDMWVTVMGSTLVGFEESMLRQRNAVWTMGVGRLAPTASVDAAQAELSAIAARLEAENPDTARNEGVRVEASSIFPGQMRLVIGGFMSMLLVIAGLVLVVASTNVAGMLLARATVRQREIAVRLALGASRAQLVRQLVTESLVLFLAAGVAGVVLAKWLVAGLLTLAPRLPFPIAIDPGLDWRVLAIAFAVSLATGIASGVVPALQSTRPDLVPALKSEGGGAGRRHRLRSALLVAQIAFSMLLLIIGGLFGRALVRARAIDPGFEPRGLHIAQMDLQLANYDSTRGRGFARVVLERSATLPGVESAALSAVLPLSGGGMGLGGVSVDGVTPPDALRGWEMDWNIVSPGYFGTMRIPLVRGRDFSDADRAGNTLVAILNETFVKALWPGQDPLGRSFRNGDRVITVIGVARDSKYRSLGESPRNFVYVPIAQNYMTRTKLLVRVRNEASPAAAVRRLVADLDPNLPILSQESFETHAAASLFPQHVALYVSGTLGGVALLLALLGIYGVTAFSVAQRTREIGVRVALGAERASVVSMVLRQGLVLAGIGVLIGSAVGLAVTRLIGALLYGVGATDGLAFIGAAAALGVAALAASVVPAMRAAAVDPVVALRAE